MNTASSANIWQTARKDVEVSVGSPSRNMWQNGDVLEVFDFQRYKFGLTGRVGN